MTCGMPSACARSQACRPPAPPKATSAKFRGSWPRSIETTRSARSMLAFTTRMTPSANCSRDNEPCALQPLASAGLGARQSSANSPPRNKSGCKRPSSRLASVTVGRVRAAAIADGAGIGARGLRPNPQRAAGVEARQRSAASADGVNVEHRNAHRETRHFGLVGGLGLATHQGDVG